MKAVVFDKTGEPGEVLTMRNLPDPVPGPRQALVRVLLSPVHPSDLHMVPLSLRSVRARVIRPILSLAGWCCLREWRGSACRADFIEKVFERTHGFLLGAQCSCADGFEHIVGTRVIHFDMQSPTRTLGRSAATEPSVLSNRSCLVAKWRVIR